MLLNLNTNKPINHNLSTNKPINHNPNTSNLNNISISNPNLRKFNTSSRQPSIRPSDRFSTKIPRHTRDSSHPSTTSSIKVSTYNTPKANRSNPNRLKTSLKTLTCLQRRKRHSTLSIRSTCKLRKTSTVRLL